MKTEIKVDNLNLSKYYNEMYEICEQLHEKHPGFVDEYGDYIDSYNPDNYSIRIFSIEHDDLIYIGNEQIPSDDNYDNNERTYNLIDYWFRGNNCNFSILYEYQRLHNKSINYKGYGCNQNKLNIIKKLIVEENKGNLNVNNVGILDKDKNNIKSWYGKNISIYKGKVRKIFKEMSLEEFSKYMLYILDDIESNINKWANMLYFMNRYWLISDIKEDIEDRNRFFNNNDKVDDKYIAILIIFKELLLLETIKKIQHQYSILFDKKEYIKNPKCKSLELYKAKNLFSQIKPIQLTLSMCYKEVWEGALMNTYKNYLKFKTSLYKNIYSK